MKTPKLAHRFLRWFCREDYLDEIEGDLLELFKKKYEVSPRSARWNFTWSVLKYFRPEFIKSFNTGNFNPRTMVRHNLVLTYRNFLRYKMSFLINLIGLSSGLACTFLIYLWVNDELTVDKFNSKDNRLFRAMEFRQRATGIWTSPTTPGPLAAAMEEDLPEVEYAMTTTWPQNIVLSVGEKNVNSSGRYTGKEFFKMFSYELIEGNEDQVLQDKNSIVISDVLAMKLFNTTDNLIGKTIELQHQSQLQVSGIFKSMPSNATDQFEFVASFEKFKEGQDWLLSWGNTGTQTLVLLKPGVPVDEFNKKIADFIKVKTMNEITHRTLFLKGYSENYLYGQYDDGKLTGGRITYVKLFSTIAVFILLIACINFMNLSTAKASRRLKEIGIKKAIGAGRGSLIAQHLGESMIMSFLAFLVGIGLVALSLSQFNIITGKHLTLFSDYNRLWQFLAITVFTGLVAGSYPALYLSGFQPATVLKGKLNNLFGALWARKGLVVVQFVLSIIFIVSVLVVYKQIEFVQSTNLGYDRDNLVYVNLVGKLQEVKTQETLIAEVSKLPGVESATSTNHDMMGHHGGTSGVHWEGKNPDDHTEFENIRVNYNMIETLGIEMTLGRSYSRSFPSDTSGIIFNEKAIEFMGLKDPIGKTVNLWGTNREIIGVTKDFHYESLHEQFKPIFMVLDPNETYSLVARVARGHEQEALAGIKGLYKKLNPEFDFNYRFLDESYQSLYESEQRVATLSKYFAVLAILISCLGLFGLAAFTAERRIREISIRKILGSSVLNIVYLLSGEFARIVLVAIVIALPVSYFMTAKWLEGFAFRVNLEWWYFFAAGLSAMVIAILTVCIQTIRAARVNPTECLRGE